MIPPSAVCKQLARDVPRGKFRLAWHGPRKEFAIVQLYHRNNFGNEENRQTFRQEWEYCWGPVYSANGSSRPDWNVDQWVPVFAVMVSDINSDNYGVMSGSVVYHARQAQIASIEKHMVKRRQEWNRDLARRADDIVDEMTDYLMYEAGKSDAGSIADVPWSDARDAYEHHLHKKEVAERHLSEYYNIPGMK